MSWIILVKAPDGEQGWLVDDGSLVAGTTHATRYARVADAQPVIRAQRYQVTETRPVAPLASPTPPAPRRDDGPSP